MSTRVDQRSKTQSSGQQQPQQQAVGANGTSHRDDCEYSHPQMHGQSSLTQPVSYTSMVSNPAANDNSYVNGYYATMGNMNYPPNFFDASTWNTSNTDAMSYLGGYPPEYMQFASGFDYAPAMNFSWPYTTNDYSSWSTGQPVDPMKVDNQQLGMLGQQPYPDYSYHSPNTATTSQRTPTTSNAVNGSDTISSSLPVEPIDTTELEMGLNGISVNGTGEHSQDSPSENSIQESAPVNINNSSSKTASSTSSTSSKPMSWANVASQPAKPMPPKPVQPVNRTHAKASNSTNDNGWENSTSKHQNGLPKNAWSTPRSNRNTNGAAAGSSNYRQQSSQNSTTTTNNGSSNSEPDPTLSKLKQTNTYNPKSFDLTAKNARFFVIKSYSEDDIHRAIKYGVWCSTEHGNKRLDAAFKEREGKGPIYLFYSVNGSGHFCGMAQMMSGVDYQTHAGVWTQDKWKGSMEIKWIYVKDVPNNQLRHIRLENNENKPVTNSRDTQEVPAEKGRQVLKIMHTYKHNTSIFDDFGHYEKKEVEESGDNSSKRKTLTTNGSKN